MRTRTLTVKTVKADLIHALATYAVDFNDIIDYVTAYDKSYNNFTISFGNGYNFGLNNNNWYVTILNLRTNNKITVDITKIVNKVK
jgi:uncharacterized protein (UPF0333 family)